MSVVEFDVRFIDAHGDADDVDSFESRDAAIAAARQHVAGGGVAAVVEKHTSNYPAHLFPEASTYTPEAAFGSREALELWGWVGEPS